MNVFVFSALGLLSTQVVIGTDPYLCPTPDSILPCECQRSEPYDLRAKINCYKITQINDLTDVVSRSGDFPFLEFYLRSSSIFYFPSEFLSMKKTEEFLIFDTTFASLFEVAPASDYLKILRLFNVRVLQGMNWQLFSNLNNLKYIYLYTMNIRIIPNSFGRQMPEGIYSVSFSGTKTNKIASFAFAPLTNVSYITVTYNHVKKLTRSMFPKPFNGWQLDFSYNEIEILPSDLFTEMPALRTIYLSGNRLSTLSESVFGNLPKSMGNVHTKDNPLICDCKMRWICRKKSNFPGKCAGNNLNAGKWIPDLQETDFNYCLYLT